MSSTVTASQVTSVEAVSLQIGAVVGSANQVTSVSSAIVVSTPAAVVLNQVMSATGLLAKQGSVIKTHDKWRVLAISESQQTLAVRPSEQRMVLQSQPQVLSIPEEENLLVVT
jgi:hypothetical protein